ncbi:hypothetical protein MICRO116_570019 [Micrococcus sp. 116]|nr:hypothetical protein MICRO116_570019 [Micrococcus sp. 116]
MSPRTPTARGDVCHRGGRGPATVPGRGRAPPWAPRSKRLGELRRETQHAFPDYSIKSCRIHHFNLPFKAPVSRMKVFWEIPSSQIESGLEGKLTKRPGARSRPSARVATGNRPACVPEARGRLGSPP